MADLDTKLEDISSLRIKIIRDLEKMSAMCARTSSELSQKFRSTFSERKGVPEGMEDLYILNNIMKKNAFSARNALNIIKRMRGTSGYDVPEEEADIQLAKIFEE